MSSFHVAAINQGLVRSCLACSRAEDELPEITMFLNTELLGLPHT